MELDDQLDSQSKELISNVHLAFKETLEVKIESWVFLSFRIETADLCWTRLESTDLSRNDKYLVGLYESI